MPAPRPRTVGLRELKNHLSEYVRLVRSGAHVRVTDRGEVVAELLPPGAPEKSDRHAGLVTLERRGLLKPGRENSADVYPLVRRSRRPGRARRLLDAVRGDR
jgi:prevent-host-death family protein